MRDYDLDFGQVRFAAALFDEAQRIKTPGVRMTDAAKAMHCKFRVAFSAEYERALDADKLARLKSMLESPFGGRVAVMKRRLKEDRLPDLPRAAERPLPRPMPAPQRGCTSICR